MLKVAVRFGESSLLFRFKNLKSTIIVEIIEFVLDFTRNRRQNRVRNFVQIEIETEKEMLVTGVAEVSRTSVTLMINKEIHLYLINKV